MSEPSAEAVVASEAAATAVEELHSREAVEDAAIAASIGSTQAAGIAEEANSTANVAVETAALSGEMASEAATVAEEARAEAASASAVASESVSETQTIRDEMAAIRQLIEERFPARETEPENAVTEVEVSGNASGNPDSGQSGNDGEATKGDASGKGAPKQEARRGLRRRHR